MKKSLLSVLSFILAGCMGMPAGVVPVQEFELDRYLGDWYEIARLDHSFERGLDHVTANYSPSEDGGVVVRNRGYSAEERSWKEAVGRAFFVRGEEEGYFRVSFFGPFYSSYVIFELDRENYRYAFVSGYKTSYLWLLSRTPTVDDEVVAKFLEKAEQSGFDTEKLLFVNQD
jgi:apolipoprotein D and lipocalin family protein